MNNQLMKQQFKSMFLQNLSKNLNQFKCKKNIWYMNKFIDIINVRKMKYTISPQLATCTAT